jgi:competence protein ComEC
VLRCRSPLSLVGHDWQLRVAPTHAGGERGNQGENDCALVVVVGLGGQQVLVPGDAEGAVLAALRLPALAVIELPHHGSAGGLDRELIGELRPRLAVVSVGENTFGHPTREMLYLMASSGIPCLRTDVVGDVSLNLTRAGLSVRTARAPP